MKIAVISPHWDDACFSVGLAVGSWLAAGHKVTVLNCFTRSEYAPFSDAGSVHPKDRMSFVTALRRREDLAWQRRYRGALKGEDLNLKDAPWRLHCDLGEIFTTAVELTDKAAGKIAKALAKLAPGAVVAPLALGGHVDHRTAREAVIAWATPGLPLSFYEDLPYAAMNPEEEIAAKVRQAAESLGGGLEPAFADDRRDVEEARALKLRLALCYDSQIEDATAEAIAGFSVRYGGRERMWANAAWRAAGLAAGAGV